MGKIEKQQKIFREVKKELWNPEQYKMIEGTIIREEVGNFGKEFVIKCPSNEEFTLPSLTVLKTKLSDVKIGDYVRITYIGEEVSKKGSTYKSFKVEIADK